MKDENKKFITGLKALSLASLITLLAGCEAEKIEEGEMPSVDVDTEGGELPSVTVNEGDLPDIDVDADAGKLPEYDIDSKLEVGTRQETITVPEITWDEDNVDDAQAQNNEPEATEDTAETPVSATQPPPHQQELFVEQQELEMLTQQESQTQQQQQDSMAQSQGQQSLDQGAQDQFVSRLRDELDSDSPALQDVATLEVQMQQDQLILEGQAQSEQSKQDIVEAAENIADGREVVDNINVSSSGAIGANF